MTDHVVLFALRDIQVGGGGGGLHSRRLFLAAAHAQAAVRCASGLMPLSCGSLAHRAALRVPSR